jgi:hypothetical protein
MDIFTNTVDVINHYPGPVVIAVAIICTGVMAWSVQRWVDAHKSDADMKRRAVLDQMYADDFGDVLFNRLMSGDIDRHEYRRDCKRFGIAYRLGDLLTRKNPKRGMKYRVTKNCAEMHRTPDVSDKLREKSNGIPVVVSRRKVWVVQGKMRPT